MNVKEIHLFFFTMLIIQLLAGCSASGTHRAPVEERSVGIKHATQDDRDAATRKPLVKKPVTRDGDTRVQVYVIQKGDTLYSIAFENGLDYREVAEQNNIENPSAIQVGQQIKLYLPEESAPEKTREETRPASNPVIAVVRKDTPKMIKLPYSEQALLQIERMQQESGQTQVAVAPPSVIPAKPRVEPTKLQPEAENTSTDGVDWSLPTKGKVIAEFSESASRKGVDIAGSKGQPIVASASGKVVYSGSGLRGYGKLVIIKHNKAFLSAYAHNDQILVKEGENVSKGQKIAEMGSSDADQVKLHFEIRLYGKPVDPAKYLNLGKS